MGSISREEPLLGSWSSCCVPTWQKGHGCSTGVSFIRVLIPLTRALLSRPSLPTPYHHIGGQVSTCDSGGNMNIQSIQHMTSLEFSNSENSQNSESVILFSVYRHRIDPLHRLRCKKNTSHHFLYSQLLRHVNQPWP